MKVLIIYAHPNPHSFNNAILETVKRGLADGQHSFDVIDLYAENFNPVLVFNDNKKRSDLSHDSETENYRNLIQKAQHLIFIYPIWWYGPPAIVKGFLDRVFVAGFAYSNKKKLRRGMLGDKTAWIVYTIDSPSWFVKIFRRNMEWKVMKKAVLEYCGIRCIKRLMFAGVGKSSLNKRQQWLNTLYKRASCGLR